MLTHFFKGSICSVNFLPGKGFYFLLCDPVCEELKPLRDITPDNEKLYAMRRCLGLLFHHSEITLEKCVHTPSQYMVENGYEALNNLYMHNFHVVLPYIIL